MNARLAIVTTENLPVFPVPCGGGGVRIWGLAESLRREGVECVFFLPEARRAEAAKKGEEIRFFRPEWLHEALNQSGCEAALFEQWQPMTFLKQEPEMPVMVDLPGPLILEYYWRDPVHFYQHIVDKVNCLSRADAFLCALERQRGYYVSWLTWAGVPPEEERLAVVPFVLHPMPRANHGQAEDEPVVFWGGLFWAWQEREKAFRTILDTLARVRRGQLVVVGANENDAPMAGSGEKDHPHCSWLGQLPFTEYLIELKRAAVSVDLCRPTAERRLASDLRTGTALWAGVPSLVTPASPWAEVIRQHNAGWVVDYDDEKGIAALIQEIALERIDIRGKRRGAREVSEEISQSTHVQPIVEWLKHPVKRERRKPFFEARSEDREQKLNAMREEIYTLRHEIDRVQHDLDSIRAHPLFRLYKRMTAPFRPEFGG